MKVFIYSFFFTFALIGCRDKSTNSTLPDICYEIGFAGDCRTMEKGYYFDTDTEKCIEFLWGGCGGNRVFETMDECVETCEK